MAATTGIPVAGDSLSRDHAVESPELRAESSIFRAAVRAIVVESGVHFSVLLSTTRLEILAGLRYFVNLDENDTRRAGHLGGIGTGLKRGEERGVLGRSRK